MRNNSYLFSEQILQMLQGELTSPPAPDYRVGHETLSEPVGDKCFVGYEPWEI